MSCDLRTNVSYETSREEQARAVAHMTLPAAGRFMPEFDTSQHHGQTHVLEVSIGIIGNGTVGGSTGQGRVRGVGRTMGDSTDLVDCAGRRGDIGRVGRSRLHSEYRCKRVRGTRSEGAAHSRDGELKLPALFDGGMSLRGMHAHTLP